MSEGSKKPGSIRVTAALAAAFACALVLPAAASAKGEEILGAASYPDMATFSCRTPALDIGAGGNVNTFDITSTCPNAQKISGNPDINADVFGSAAVGYITRFKPSMLEVLPGGGTTTPSVWDLHLHHVVWLKDPAGLANFGKPTFASGEEKTEVKLPRGYGIKTTGSANWALNYMIHNLTAQGGRQVYITWEIDWVPVTDADVSEAKIQWLDVAGYPQAIYPVFDAEKGYDLDGDGEWTFPDDVPSDPSQPGYEEREKMSASANWTVPSGGRTLVFGAGHLHPGGTSVDLEVSRDLDNSGTAGDDAGETKPLFSSNAHYYEPAGAISWDVSMQATRPDWRIAVKAGDIVSVDATYDVSKASWYESMGILPLAVADTGDSAAKDPFDDAAAVGDMYGEGGILTHGRLTENIDSEANVDLGLPDPRKLKDGPKVTRSGIDIDGFRYGLGGYSAFEGVSSVPMRPAVVKAGKPVLFTNLEAQPGMTNQSQVWHSITSCKAPCNRGSGIGYPLANGPIKFDSGQLGYGQLLSAGVTTGSNQYTLKPLPKAGKTYTYFCRIHPFMRGSIRVAESKHGRRNR